jgi:enoyl-CoA hydratase
VNRLLVSDEDGLRTITFNRPEAKNALTVAMRREFCELLDAADRDTSVKAVIITGTDPVFTAGVDFKDVDPSFDPRQRQFTVNPGRALRAMRTPVVCAVNGACVSGGLEIVLSATFVIASERARFADTHARLNVVPGWGLTALLPRAVGLRKAREMSLTGNFVDAEEALRIGLVNHVVVPHGELMPFTVQLVRQITDTPAAGEVLALYDQCADLGLNAALAFETRVAANRAWDSDAFAAAGRAAAARQRNSSS